MNRDTWRNLAAFWCIGVLNNSAYVIMNVRLAYGLAVQPQPQNTYIIPTIAVYNSKIGFTD